MEEGKKGRFKASLRQKEPLALSFCYSIVYVIYIDEHILKSSISAVCLNLSKKIWLRIGSFLKKNGERDNTGLKFDGFRCSQDYTACIQQLLSTAGSTSSWESVQAPFHMYRIWQRHNQQVQPFFQQGYPRLSVWYNTNSNELRMWDWSWDFFLEKRSQIWIMISAIAVLIYSFQVLIFQRIFAWDSCLKFSYQTKGNINVMNPSISVTYF